MQDRLQDLRQLATDHHDLLPLRASAIYELKRNDRTELNVFEAQVGISQANESIPSDGFMVEYMGQINTIKTGVANIRQIGERVRYLKGQMVLTATPATEKELSDELQKCMNEANKSIMATKKALESLKQENDLFRSRNPDSSEARIRENMHAVVTRKFRELLTEFQTIQTEYKKTVKEKIERQVKIVYPEASEKEVQEMVDGADAGVAQQAIFARMTGVHEALDYAYQDIQDKHRDVKRLEQSVQELHQMFVDLATLVEAQGELLDQIEYAVGNAKDYTEKAEKDLVQARRNQQKSKKWACWISTCLIILCVIVILPVVVYLSA
eukprot:Protomagalhaensia_wolfi_Nauph_80__1967@NODE_2241_length_1157_cov_38_588551_g1748_i0_p1_GENE_NODE_2241_length_1157_cov_38_588551_g1748_i0NODE_2241_length_1157_cov_38_588551_g1748_i0_p1_ORF_typecomplete_len325_score41_74Syntaxin/PF00804_25/1_6e47SNARE/PF05739_19/2_8e02SNARE/PF05739_19/6_2e14Syntaxin_2/PF14523_6/3_6e06Syntaxin_2/PF14523_6/46Cas_Csy1/PF09611_10/0_0014Cas_Csy1/PF09611_10/1_1e03Helo_like_N/PF17111_5/50Helo_like_N/PF17111_5/0_012Orf78/PF06024_12/0_0066Synaptobrevin/PF00957_21/1_9e03Syn